MPHVLKRLVDDRARGSKATGVLFRHDDGNPERHGGLEEQLGGTNHTVTARRRHGGDEFFLEIDHEKRGLLGHEALEWHAAFFSRLRHRCQGSGGKRSLRVERFVQAGRSFCSPLERPDEPCAREALFLDGCVADR